MYRKEGSKIEEGREKEGKVRKIKNKNVEGEDEGRGGKEQERGMREEGKNQRRQNE